MRLILGVAIFLTVSVAACVAEPVSSASSEGELLELGLPLEGEVAERVWRSAPSGCEGRLSAEDIEHIAWAENAPGLGVVLDEHGDPLCVDTLESIAVEVEKVKGDPSPDPMRPAFIR